MELAKIRNLGDEELAHQEKVSAEQLFRLRFQVSMGQNDGVKKLRQLRKEIAQIKTVARERELGIRGETRDAKQAAAPVEAEVSKASEAAPVVDAEPEKAEAVPATETKARKTKKTEPAAETKVRKTKKTAAAAEPKTEKAKGARK